MAADTIAHLETAVKGRAHLVGRSDGAVVALLVALQRPDLLDSIVYDERSFVIVDADGNERTGLEHLNARATLATLAGRHSRAGRAAARADWPACSTAAAVLRSAGPTARR